MHIILKFFSFAELLKKKRGSIKSFYLLLRICIKLYKSAVWLDCQLEAVGRFCSYSLWQERKWEIWLWAAHSQNLLLLLIGLWSELGPCHVIPLLLFIHCMLLRYVAIFIITQCTSLLLFYFTSVIFHESVNLEIYSKGFLKP